MRLHYTNLPGVVAWWLSGRVLRRRTVTARDARLYDRWMIALDECPGARVDAAPGAEPDRVARKDA